MVAVRRTRELHVELPPIKNRYTLSEASLAQKRKNVKEIALRARAKETCKRGHNDWAWARKEDGVARRYCRTCRSDRMWYKARGIPYE